MVVMRFFGVFCLFQCVFQCASAPVQESKFPQIPSRDALKFLKRFGYVQEDDGESEALYTEDGISDIIKTMQRFGAIEETGVFDNATMKLMSSPRCGVPDIIRPSRQKRYVLGPSGWNKRNLTYFLANWSPKLGEGAVVKNIQKALDIWGDYGRLFFRRVYSPDADIIVAFGSGYHGDIFPFDGPGNILAHAFFPSSFDNLGGDIHFDDDETWVDGISKKKGTDFFTVALHELGHSLGLAHSPVESSVMFPYYKRPESGGEAQLGYDDILGMYDLYIKRILEEDKHPFTSTRYHDDGTTSRQSTTTSTTHKSTTRKTFETTERSRPTRASTTHSTTPATTRKSTYDKERTHSTTRTTSSTVTYEGDYEFVEQHKGHEGRRNSTDSISPDICDGHVDAIATLRDELFVFRGQFIWRYKEKGRLEKGYPVKLHEMFPKLPKSIKKIDAAYQRPDGMIVLFTGKIFWLYDGSDFSKTSPQPLTYYGLPDYLSNIDAVQNWKKNKKTYFFKNDRFWRYNESSNTMDPGYPMPMTRWRRVPENLDAAITWKDGVTYFFRGGLYWKFDNNWVIATDESPLPTPQVWFGCSENSNKIIQWFSARES